jgi:uncharacterized sporulation protein YeaH/YhbH (DUF444 family)
LTSVIVDRRAQKGKSTANRQRLLKRLDGALKAQLGKLVARHKMQDTGQPAEVTIERRDATEPRLILDPASGSSGRIVPGNDKYRIGDKIVNSPSQGHGSGNGQGAGDGDADEEDTFRFVLSRTEYLSLLFDDLELPALVKKDLLEIDENRFRRGGVVRYGNPGSVCVTRTFKASIGRRVAAEAQHAEALEEAETALIAARRTGDRMLMEAAERALDEVSRRTGEIPFLDPIDLRHRSLVEVPSPCTAAVMFCLMDVSSSMDEARKDLAKRFFMLLHLFLTRKYKKVALVFIRHTDAAQEVDEEMFFNGTQAGSTKVLSALEKIIASRYPSSSYNIFGAQASDGDSFGGDSTESSAYLRSQLLPLSRYFVYAEVGSNPLQGSTTLWSAYRAIESDRFNMASLNARNQVYPALAKLFQKEP